MNSLIKISSTRSQENDIITELRRLLVFNLKVSAPGDGRVDDIPIVLDISEKRVERSVAVQCLGPVGDHTLQIKPLVIASGLRHQKATTRIPLTDHFRGTLVRFHESGAYLQKQKKS